jgi:hypothetical protein
VGFRAVGVAFDGPWNVLVANVHLDFVADVFGQRGGDRFGLVVCRLRGDPDFHDRSIARRV